MASILFVLFLCIICSMTAAQQEQFKISLGSSLTPINNSTWLSNSGLYAFGFYPATNNGNSYAIGIFLAGIPQRTVVWTANRDNPPVSSNTILQLTTDGRLILQSMDGQETNVASYQKAASYASMLDTGNFVVYSSDQSIIWQSFDLPTDTLLPSQQLKANMELFSSVSDADHSKGIFSLKMQDDGNLVQYPVEDFLAYVNNAYYGSGTYGRDSEGVALNLDSDGHLYLVNSTGIYIKNFTDGYTHSAENYTTYLMRIDADGIFRLYSYKLNVNGDWSVLWESSVNRCDPKGLCGLNAYCVLNDIQPDCKCIPGYKFLKLGNWSAGCEKDVMAESYCKVSDPSRGYVMDSLENTEWENIPFSVLYGMDRDDCKNACLGDCMCEAALFTNGECRKQRLPLRYGRRNLQSSDVAFIRVPTTVNRSKKEFQKAILVVTLSFVAFSLVMFVTFGVLFHKTHVWAHKMISTNNGTSQLNYDGVAPRSFTYAELEKVTRGFKEEIGHGAFGTVYKGFISHSQKVVAVAVKKLEKVLAEGEHEFQTEIRVIGKTHHRNLVQLLGYCLDGPHRLLVYEYMSNGTLADVLFNPEKQPCLDERLEIARDVARGILYLHEECETQIIHCDIKPQNILMDDNMHAKISDFGMAKLLKPNQINTLTRIRGTRGYVAPEWHKKLAVSVKADVYSYGIVLLEIICCRKNVDWSLPEEEAVLEGWVYRCFEAGELSKLVGAYEEFDNRPLERMVKVGLWCILDQPSLRPSMKKVLLMLEGTVDIPVPPNPTSFLSAL